MFFSLLYMVFRGVFRLAPAGDQRDRDIELLVLRHQAKVLQRKVSRPKLRRRDRLLLAAAARLLPRERWSSFIVTPATHLTAMPSLHPTVHHDGTVSLFAVRNGNRGTWRAAMVHETLFGCVAMGLVWGWVLGLHPGMTLRSLPVVLVLCLGTLALGVQAFLLVGLVGAASLAAGTLVASFLHLAWRVQLKAAYGPPNPGGGMS